MDEGQRQDARDEDQVQDAEEDEGAGIEPPRAERDQQRRREDDGEAPEIGAGAEAVPQGEDEVDPDQGQEGAGDGAGEDPPAELVGHVDADELVGREVPREVVDDHRDDRDALEDVDDGESRGALRRDGARGCRHGSSCLARPCHLVAREILRGNGEEAPGLNAGLGAESVGASRRQSPPPLPVSDEGNHISIGIADVKVSSAPRLHGRRLGELRATFLEFIEQPLKVGDLDGGRIKETSRAASSVKFGWWTQRRCRQIPLRETAP